MIFYGLGYIQTVVVNFWISEPPTVSPENGMLGKCLEHMKGLYINHWFPLNSGLKIDTLISGGGNWEHFGLDF